MASTPNSATTPPVVPSGYRSQSADTSPQADWVLFEQLRRMPASDRYQRFRSFNSAWRSRLWWLCTPTPTAVRWR
ncbi:hypothetical protein H6F67_25580 [Microcoleus sp. FACHB-1515]|uniref:hypothetical protein n=1 Tax=Cyanophyceae TaxID=3028117 RepID=UPI00168935A0|nr:hypothetical protein [Microcoleus sp. FACHB-1515]MBD2093219.1 hypothetical protein [Microcoleus sp. FACHB-1515]